MELTNSAFADQGLTESILVWKIGQMDWAGGQIYWYRSNLGQKSSYWCYRAIPEGGGGLGDVRCNGWNISRHLRKPWIRWKPCHRRKPVDTMGTWTAFWPFSYLPFHLGNKTFNWETKYEQTKNVLQKHESHIKCEIHVSVKPFGIVWNSNCFTERENLWIIYWVIFTCTVKEETGESFGPKKLNIQKGKCW